MPWKIIDPTAVKPEMFDLAQVTVCKVKEFRGSEDALIIRMNGWHLFVNLLKKCPVTGSPLKEPTWYLFAAQGIPDNDSHKNLSEPFLPSGKGFFC